SDQTSPKAQAFHATFPDKPQDAEAIWVTAKREVFVVTKGETEGVTVYQFPPDRTRNGATVTLKRVAHLASDPKRREMVTDAALSPDGRWVVTRTDRSLFFYEAASIVAGKPGTPVHVDVTGMKEPQGEG